MSGRSDSDSESVAVDGCTVFSQEHDDELVNRTESEEPEIPQFAHSDDGGGDETESSSLPDAKSDLVISPPESSPES